MNNGWEKPYPWENETPETVPQVVVHWRDIRDCTSYAWDEEDEEIRPARKLQTIGWLLYQGPDPKEPDVMVTVIARTYDGEEKRWAEYSVFPQIVVKKLHEKTVYNPSSNISWPVIITPPSQETWSVVTEYNGEGRS
jgi:hypothetical protein